MPETAFKERRKMSGQNYLVCLLTIIALLFIPLTSFSQENDEELISSPGIVLLSPAQFATVAPSEAVEVNVSIDPSLNPKDVFVTGKFGTPFPVLFLKQIPSQDSSKLHFQASLMIPDESSGPQELMGAVTNDTGIVGGFMMRLNIIPKDIPVEIEVDKDFRLKLPARKFEGNRTIHVKGKYAKGTTRNIRSHITGTQYKSMDQSVVTVTDSGVLNPVGSGRTYVTVEHRGHRAFVHVEVTEQGQSDLPAIDQTDKVLIMQSIPRRLPDSDRYEVNVTVQNTSEFPLALPLDLVVIGLDKDIEVMDVNLTSKIQPIGSPIIFVETDEDAYLPPDVTAEATITFRNYTKKKLDYSLKLYSD